MFISFTLLLIALHFSRAAEITQLKGNEDVLSSNFALVKDLQLQSLTNEGVTSLGAEGLTDDKENGFAIMKSSKTKEGKSHVKLAQTYKGYKVWGAQIIAHQESDGKSLTSSLTGRYIEGIAEDLASVDMKSLNRQKGARVAKLKRRAIARHGRLRPSDVEITDESSELIVYVDEERKKSKAVAAFLIDFVVDAPKMKRPQNPQYIVLARSGRVLKTWDAVKTQVQDVGTGPGGNQGEGLHTYGVERGKLRVTVNGNTCSMVNEYVSTSHIRNTKKKRKYRKPFEYSCFEQNTDELNGGYSALNDVHYYATRTFQMFEQWYGVRVTSFVPTLYVHYKKKWSNAMFVKQYAAFGDGDNVWYPWTCIDTVGHELAHGFGGDNSDLVYRGMSGGIEEGFADIAGKAVEFFEYGHVLNGWTVGQCESKDNDVLRYMDDPTKDGWSIGDARDYRRSLGVHLTSGVFNKFYYLLATTEGWDPHTAFDPLVCANMNYWISTSSFQEAAEGVLSCTLDLGYDTVAVITAFAGVGISVAV